MQIIHFCVNDYKSPLYNNFIIYKSESFKYINIIQNNLVMDYKLIFNPRDTYI